MISGCGKKDETKDDKKEEDTSGASINGGDSVYASTDPTGEASEMTLVSLKLPAMT